MIEKTYRCDLCRIRQEVEHLVGIYWSTKDKIETRPVNLTEHHLCLDCLNGLAEIRAKMEGDS